MKITINRDTEKAIFTTPAIIKFKIKGKIDRGMVVFGVEAVRQMQLHPKCLVEFEIEDNIWYVKRTDSANGYALFTVGNRGNLTLACNANKLVRGFLSKHGITDPVCEVILNKEASPGNVFAYSRWRMTVREKIK